MWLYINGEGWTGCIEKALLKWASDLCTVKNGQES